MDLTKKKNNVFDVLIFLKLFLFLIDKIQFFNKILMCK